MTGQATSAPVFATATAATAVTTAATSRALETICSARFTNPSTKGTTMKSLHIHITRMVLTLSLLAAGSLPSASAASKSEPIRLSGHVPAAAVATAQVLGRVAPTERIPFAFV